LAWQLVHSNVDENPFEVFDISNETTRH